MNRKRQAQEETWSRGTNSRLPFDVKVMLNLSNNQDKPESNPTVQFERTQIQAHAQPQMAISYFCRIHFASHRCILVFAVNAALSLFYWAACGPVKKWVSSMSKKEKTKWRTNLQEGVACLILFAVGPTSCFWEVWEVPAFVPGILHSMEAKNSVLYSLYSV